MTEQLDRIEQNQIEIIGQMTTLIEINVELKEAITTLSNSAHGKLNVLQSDVENIRLMLRTTPPPIPQPEPDEHAPIFSSGAKGTRRVQMSENTRVRIAKVKDGVIQRHTESGNLFYWKPTDGMKLFRGAVHVVWRPYVQGDGDRLWEMYEYPGRFIKNRQCSFV